MDTEPIPPAFGAHRFDISAGYFLDTWYGRGGSDQRGAADAIIAERWGRSRLGYALSLDPTYLRNLLYLHTYVSSISDPCGDPNRDPCFSFKFRSRFIVKSG